MRFVIPSHGRSDWIERCTLRFFPDALICVEDTEADDYKGIGQHPLLVHPPMEAAGLAPVMNWILECPDIKDDCVVVVHDDLKSIRQVLTYPTTKLTDPLHILSVVRNLRTMAEGCGARCWGFIQNRPPDAMRPHKPFSYAGRLGGFIGFSDRSVRWDEDFLYHIDDDFGCQELLENRITFRDDRFCLDFTPIFITRGGNLEFYLDNPKKDEELRLRKKWGKYIRFSYHRRFGITTTKLSVRR